jgi:hypothetical protein
MTNNDDNECTRILYYAVTCIQENHMRVEEVIQFVIMIIVLLQMS